MDAAVLTLLTTGILVPGRLKGDPKLPAAASKVGMSFSKSLLLEIEGIIIKYKKSF